jgi:nickel superoxide dismutase
MEAMRRMKTTRALAGLTAALAMALALAPTTVKAHCQIPCGIYDDEMRFRMLEEHITTIEKSMNLVNELSAEPSKNANQLVRWVMNKEHHADEMVSIVTQYFLQQRLKPEEAETNPEKWTARVKACHQILVYAMKAKQTTDLANIEKLRAGVSAFKQAYFTKEQARLMEEHPWHSHME